jgi:hypothetical protein
MEIKGILSKMRFLEGDPINYHLTLGEVQFDLTSKIGGQLKLNYTGQIFCINCKKKTKKSYSQGYCYPCTLKLAECDLCILKPETCHFDKGTCREPEWAEKHCMQPHIVYLANSSGIKVGITRKSQMPTRWIDQGAFEALPILEVKNRKTSGLIEVLFKKHISDKTDWRKMLKGHPEQVDLLQLRNDLFEKLKEELKDFEYKIIDSKVHAFHYPVIKYPEKVNSLGLDKTSEINSKLIGIKGQYLIFEDGVFNVRAHTGYEVVIEE